MFYFFHQTDYIRLQVSTRADEAKKAFGRQGTRQDFLVMLVVLASENAPYIFRIPLVQVVDLLSIGLRTPRQVSEAVMELGEALE